MSAHSEPMKMTSPTLHLSILLTIAAFVTILVMSYVFKVEVVARGEGRVVPVSRVQVIQPEFAGRIKAIHVRNGAVVQEGTVLIEFDSTDAVTTLGALSVELQRLLIEMARIDAFVGILSLDADFQGLTDQVLSRFEVPREVSGDAFVAEQRTLLAAEVDELLAALAQIDAREVANRSSERVTNANIDRIGAALELQAERLDISGRLVDQGTTSRSVFLDVQQVFTELEREREVSLRELDQKIAERSALNSERRRVIADLRSARLERRSQIDSRIATLSEEIRAAQRRVDATTLTAPTMGVVDQLNVFTIGGIAEAGAELLRIVPTNAQIEIEGIFSNQDIGFMTAGQQANIRLDAFPSERFGFVSAKVVDIAADSTEAPEGTWGYRVRIMPDKASLTAGADEFALRPGMTATIDVTTDSRRIISYFFAPIVRTIQDAMGER
ncbi:MAG: HlyD family type I secretion periplasmic adaptor subunit [Aliishimia sp.]